eukprot:2233044-Prymnesium_polylepis.1
MWGFLNGGLRLYHDAVLSGEVAVANNLGRGWLDHVAPRHTHTHTHLLRVPDACRRAGGTGGMIR